MSAPIKHFTTHLRRYVRTKLKLEKKLNRNKENTFKIDSLEPRILLSADPVAGALQDVIIIEEQASDEQTQGTQSQQEQTIILNEQEQSSIIELEDLLNDSDSLDTLLNIEAGEILKGTGTFEGEIVNDGIFAPGHSPGVVNVDGDYTQATDATLEIEIWGAGGAGDNTAHGDAEYGFDQINITGAANLDGALQVSLLDTYTPQIGDTYTIMTYDSYNGFFNVGEGLYGWHSDYYFEIVQSDKQIDLVVREIVEGDLFEITSPNLNEADLTTFNDSLGMLLNSDDFAQATQTVTFNGAINIVDAFVATGEFSIGASLSKDVSVVDEGEVNTTMFTFSASDLDIQIGTDNFGLTLDNTDFSMALFSSNVEGDDRSWLVSEATTATASFNGLDFVDFTSTNISLDISMGLGDDNATVLDLSNNILTVGSIDLDTDGALGEHTSVDASASLSVGDFFEVSGDFAIDKYSKDLTLSDESTISTDIFTIGASDVNSFLGLDRTSADKLGFDVVGAEFALAFINDEADNTYTGLGLEATSASVVGIDDFTLSATNIFANKNSSNRDDGIVIDFAAANLDIRTSSNTIYTLNKEGIEGGSYDVSLTGDLKVGEIFETTGDFSVAMEATHEIVLAGDEATTVNTSMMAFAAVDLDILIGSEDFGIDVIDTDFAMAYFNSLEDGDSRKWLNIESTTSTIDLKGLPQEITIEPTDIGVYINQGLGDGNESVVNLSGDNAVEIGGILLDNDGAKGEQVTVDVTAKLAVDDYLYLEGDFSIEKLQKNLTLSDSTSVDTNIFTFGGDDVSLFAGLNRTKDDELGLNVTNADFAIAVIKEGDINKYTSVSIDAQGASLVGVDSLTLSAGRTLVDINKSNRSDGVTVDFATINLDVRTSGTTSLTMDTKGIYKGSFDATVNDAKFIVDQFVHVSGSASLSLGKETDLKVQSATASESELSLKDIKASYIEVAVLDADVFVGYGDSYFGEGEASDSVGLYLNDVDVGFASYKQLTTSDNYDGMSFTSLKATAANAGIVGTEDYLQATLEGVVLDVNIGKTSNTLLNSYVDYKATYGDAGKVFEFDGGDVALDYDTSIIGVSVSNAHLELSEFLYLDGAIAFTKNTTLDATINNGLISTEATSQATLDVMTIAGYNLSGFAGVGGHDSDDRVGVEVVDASFAAALMKIGMDAPAHLQKSSFLAAKATIGNASLIGMDEVITADFREIELNINTGKSPLNTTVFEPLPNVDFKASTTDGAGLKVSTGLNSGNDVEGEDFFMLDFDKELAELSIASANLSILGILQARGAITIAKRNEEVYLKDAAETTAMQSLSLGMQDMDAFVGVGNYFDTPEDAVGFKVDNLDLGAVIMAPADLGSVSPVQYLAINSSLDNASIIGLGDVLTADISDFKFEANISIINGKVGGVADPVMDLSRSGEDGGVYKVKAGSDDNLIPLDYDNFLLTSSGHIVLSGYGMFELDTFFDLEIDGNDIGLFIGDGKLSIGSDDSFKVSELNVDGVFALNADGIATHFEIDTALNLVGLVDISSDIEVNINTMGKDYTYIVPQEFQTALGYNSVTVSATPKGEDSVVERYLQLDGKGDIEVATDVLEVQGDVSLLLSQDGVNVTQKVVVDGRLRSDLFNSADAMAEFTMTNEGAYGSVMLAGNIISTTAFALNGHYITQFNTTNSKKTVRDIVVVNGVVVNDQATRELEAKENRFAGAGEVSVGGAVTLDGDFDMSYSVKGIEGDFDLKLDMGGFGDTRVAGALAILNTHEGPVFALNGTAQLDIGADIVSIKGDGNVEINTSSTTEYAGVDAGTTFYIGLDASLDVSLLELASVKGSISLVGDEFKAEITEAKFDFFGIVTSNMTGYVTSGGDFKFNMDTDFGIDLGIVWMKAGVSVELSNNGFKADIDGGIGASVTIPYWYDFFEGEWLYKEFSASIGFGAHAEFSDILVHLAAEIEIMGITISGDETFFRGGKEIPPAVIATQVGDTLYLNTGSRASYRGDDYLDVVDEKYEITGSSGGNVNVSALGVQSSFTGVNKIVSNSGDGDDFISVGSGVDAKLEFDGGTGNDSFMIFSADSSSVVAGGAGDDYYMSLSDKSTGRFYGEDGNDIFVGGNADDIIDLGSGYNTAYGGAGDDVLILDVAQNTKFDGGSGYDKTTLTTTMSEFEINDYQIKSDDITLNVTSTFDELNINNTSSNLNIKGGSSVNSFAGTNINIVNSGNINLTGNSFNTRGIYSLKTTGDIDVNNASLISPNGTVYMQAGAIVGEVQSELDALSIKTTNSSKATNLVLVEKDDLTLLKDGINLSKGSLDIELSSLESNLTLKEGVINSTGDINIVSDDIDFLSGTNKVSSSGVLNITSKNSVMDYKIGGAAESIYGIDYTQGDPTGFLNFSQTDLAALKNGFSSINIGDVDDTIYIGDIKGDAILDDRLNLVANNIIVQGNANSNDAIVIATNTLEINRQNKKNPSGAPDSGLEANNFDIDIDEQFYLGGWLKAKNTLDLSVNNSDGIGSIYNEPSGTYSFIGDASGLIEANNVNFTTSSDMKIGSKITGKNLNIQANGFVDLTDTGRIIVNEDNGAINLTSQKKILVNGVLSAGASFDEASGDWIEDGSNVTLTVEAQGELKLSGAISASGDMNLKGGTSEEDYANFFDTIPGSTIATVDVVNLNLVNNADLDGIKKLFEDNKIDLGDNFEFSNIDSLKEFYELSDAQKDKVAQSLGYQTKTGTYYFNPEADASKQLLTTLKAGTVLDTSGYTHYSSTVFVNPKTFEIQSSFIQGQTPDYSNADIDWADGGVSAPSNNASFDSLSLAQKEVVADYLGYKTSDGGENWVNLGADFDKRYKTTFTQAYKIDYANNQIAWGDALTPSQTASFSSLTSAQKAVVAQSLGYDMYENGVYVNQNADDGYRFVERLVVGDYAINIMA